MLDLPISEMGIFIFVLAVSMAAGIAGILQLRADGEKFRHLLSPLICLAVTAEAIMLVFRAAAIKAIPLTGLFESMIVLTIVFGLFYLFLSLAVRRVWFGSIMAWSLLAMVLLTAIVAKPASQPMALAATPWAIVHGITMVSGGASIAFATASALLYLFGNRKLKQKRLTQVLGRVPNLERLEQMNLLGIKAGFILITIGLLSGLGLASVIRINIIQWLTDSKIVLIMIVWVLLAIILILRYCAAWKGKAVQHMTIVVFILILFAIVGTTIFCGTRHNFATDDVKTTEIIR